MTSGQEARFGKYILRRQLGAGGMAQVYLAEMTGPEGFQRLVALKRILPELTTQEEFIDSFISEARLGGSLNHPNIVQTLELGREQGQYYLAMEYVQGQTLHQLLRHRRDKGEPLPLSVALDVAKQLCEALSYAHNAADVRGNPLKMIHRDMKPDNVLLGEHGQVKITDFGVARASTALRHTVDQSVIKGTVAYMSPEQACGTEIDARSDLYSLGAILFEMLTLEPLYPNAYGYPGLALVQEGNVAERLKLLGHLPPMLIQTMTRLLSADKKQRHGHAGELKRELLAVQATVPASFFDLAELVQEAVQSRAKKEQDTWAISLDPKGVSQGSGLTMNPAQRETAPRERGQAQAGHASGLQALLDPQPPLSGSAGQPPAPALGLPPSPAANKPRDFWDSGSDFIPMKEGFNPLQAPTKVLAPSDASLLASASMQMAVDPASIKAPAQALSDAPAPPAAQFADEDMTDGRTVRFEPGMLDAEGSGSSSPEMAGEQSPPDPPREETTAPSPLSVRQSRAAVASTRRLAPEELDALRERLSAPQSVPTPAGGARVSPQAGASVPASSPKLVLTLPESAQPAGGTQATPKVKDPAPTGSKLPLLVAGGLVVLLGLGLAVLQPWKETEQVIVDEPAKAESGGTVTAEKTGPDVQGTAGGSLPTKPGDVQTHPAGQSPGAQTAPAAAAPAKDPGAGGDAPTKLPVPAPVAPVAAPVPVEKPASRPHDVAKPVTVKESGFVTVNAVPFANVYLKGRRLGETPLIRVRLPAGSHALSFKTEDGRQKSVSVTIKPGEETKLPPVTF